jgi:hypothetical protein
MTKRKIPEDTILEKYRSNKLKYCTFIDLKTVPIYVYRLCINGCYTGEECLTFTLLLGLYQMLQNGALIASAERSGSERCCQV